MEAIGDGTFRREQTDGQASHSSSGPFSLDTVCLGPRSVSKARGNIYNLGISVLRPFSHSLVATLPPTNKTVTLYPTVPKAKSSAAKTEGENEQAREEGGTSDCAVQAAIQETKMSKLPQMGQHFCRTGRKRCGLIMTIMTSDRS